MSLLLETPSDHLFIIVNMFDVRTFLRFMRVSKRARAICRKVQSLSPQKWALASINFYNERLSRWYIRKNMITNLSTFLVPGVKELNDVFIAFGNTKHHTLRCLLPCAVTLSKLSLSKLIMIDDEFLTVLSQFNLQFLSLRVNNIHCFVDKSVVEKWSGVFTSLQNLTIQCRVGFWDGTPDEVFDNAQSMLGRLFPNAIVNYKAAGSLFIDTWECQ